MLFYLSCFGLKEGVKCTWHALINCTVCTGGVVSTARELLSIVIVLRWTVRTRRYAFFCCRLSLPIRVKGTVRCQLRALVLMQHVSWCTWSPWCLGECQVRLMNSVRCTWRARVSSLVSIGLMSDMHVGEELVLSTARKDGVYCDL